MFNCTYCINDFPIIIYEDNQGAIKLEKKAKYYNWAKYIIYCSNKNMINEHYDKGASKSYFWNLKKFVGYALYCMTFSLIFSELWSCWCTMFYVTLFVDVLCRVHPKISKQNLRTFHGIINHSKDLGLCYFTICNRMTWNVLRYVRYLFLSREIYFLSGQSFSCWTKPLPWYTYQTSRQSATMDENRMDQAV